MRDVLEELIGWWQAGETVGMGTVVATWRSAPRPAGAAMLVGPDGTAVGSVSGGCVEGAVYEEAKDAVETAEPRLQRYGVSDDDAFAVGLTCGGILDLFGGPVARGAPRRAPRGFRGGRGRGGRPPSGGRSPSRSRGTSRWPSSRWSRGPTTGSAGGWCAWSTAARGCWGSGGWRAAA